MDWINSLIGVLLFIGLAWAVRDWVRGSKIVDERDLTEAQTEAERAAMRAFDHTRL